MYQSDYTCCVFILNIRTQNIETFRETSADIGYKQIF